jgi:hypothetical protein
MGLCQSRRRQTRSDSEPLLPTVNPRDQLPPPQSQLEKAADVAAAIAAGKLPSNDQLARVLRVVLRFLRSEPVPEGDEALSRRGQRLVKDVEEIVEATLQVAVELNCGRL